MLLNQSGMEAIVILPNPGVPIAQDEVLSAIKEADIKKVLTMQLSKQSAMVRQVAIS